ncbi:MAG TPA: glycosyltransferase family 1 protein [Thermoanaerobaculia bacterium]|jgi:alpha-1,3-rhamnosyl/mannosyltransferase|nr:glycosyltransferase family 1 protein [Thermoanaerobaculia bacterium]
MRVGIDARKIGDFGIGTYIRGLLGGLIALDTNDQYMAFAPADAPIPNGVEHIVVNAPHYSIRELLILGRAADRANLDVFHAPHYVTPFTRVPLVVTIHDLIHLHQPMRNPLAPLYARTMIRRAIKHARCVLTVTHAVKAQLEHELGAENVIVTPNGVISSDNRQPTTDNFFLYVGNDKPHKNVDALMDAFALVRKEIDARLVLVGAPFERFRSRDGVDARGFVEDDELSSLYRSALALVMPSLEEGFGLPAAEAMAHGTAVITSNDAALVEVTSDAALHVDARDVRALADSMLRVARDEELREQLAKNGIDRARIFTWKRCAELTRDAYRVT